MLIYKVGCRGPHTSACNQEIAAVLYIYLFTYTCDYMCCTCMYMILYMYSMYQYIMCTSNIDCMIYSIQFIIMYIYIPLYTYSQIICIYIYIHICYISIICISLGDGSCAKCHSQVVRAGSCPSTPSNQLFTAPRWGKSP